MIPLYTTEQVRAMDRRAFEGGVASVDLMERAAGHLARGVLAVGGWAYGLRVAICCGKGNNGGDGLAAARRLRIAGAWPVVHLVAHPGELTGDAAVQLGRWQEVGGRVSDSLDAALDEADVAVDCLLGTGARGEPRGPYRTVIAALNARQDLPVVACDLPSGVDADTGTVHGDAVRADLTVTLGAHKRGLWLWPARGRCGRLGLGDLGIVEPDDAPAARVLEPADAARLLPAPAPGAHKRTRGVVVVLAGSPGMTGAATLVARGAMAAGAGLVTVATAESCLPLVAPTVPEALTTGLRMDDPAAAFERLARSLEGADAIAVGPGLGLAGPTVELVRRLVAEVELPVVLDADGLNAFRHEGDRLGEHKTPLLVCTPHAGELARLVGPQASRSDEMWGARAEVVPELAQRWGAVVVAKGPGSVVAAPDGRVWVNPTGTAALATGGTGDVLTGITATLVAQRADAESAAAAVYLHGLAGEVAAEADHPRSVTALDVARAVPKALRRIEGTA